MRQNLWPMHDQNVGLLPLSNLPGRYNPRYIYCEGRPSFPRSASWHLCRISESTRRAHVNRTLGNRVLPDVLYAVFSAMCLVLVMTGCNSGSSTPPPPPAPISVSITPVRGGMIISQSSSFTAALQNDVGLAGVTWTATSGSFSSQGKTTATYLAPNAAGNVT